MSDKSEPLSSLYPFLHHRKKDPEAENKALLESVSQKSQHSIDTKATFFKNNAQSLVNAAKSLAHTYTQGGKLLSMGNGGSSCDATHIAVEFQHPVTAGRPSLPAFNMNNDNAFFSAVANDVGISHVFTRQIEAHGHKNDCVIGFSTSGNSENLLSGFRKAHEMGLTTIGFAGGNGGDMKTCGLLDHCLVVDCDSIHRVQEVHVACYHILWDLTHTLLADSRGHLSKENTL
ncbi:MAG TPA: SIS domain-containing protein [Aeromonadales bacterium]|nr:SIS domain-containing protein [Aeromonadales bacterium]